MNFFDCRRLVALMLSCGAVVIVTVNGQATTDDDIGTEENYVELTALLAKMEDSLPTAVDEIAKLKNNLVTAVDEIAKLKNNSATAVDENAKLKNNLAAAVDEIAKLKNNLATTVDEIAKLKDHVNSVTANKSDDSKFNFFDT